MDGMTSQMGPALLAMAIVMFAAALAFTVRRRMLGDPRARAKQAEAAATRRHTPKNPILAQPAGPRRDIDLDAIHAAVPDFDLSVLLRRCRSWFLEAQVARGSGDRGPLEEHLLPGALDTALASGPGLDSVGSAWVLFVQPTQLGGSPDGCRVVFRIRALVEETRNNTPMLLEVDESWSLGWAPATDRWRVLQVERTWRRVLERPVINREAEPPAKRARIDELLERDGAEVDLDEVIAAAMLVAPEWATSAQEDAPERLEGLATKGFRQGVAGWHARHRHFGIVPRWELVVDEVTPVRVLLEPKRKWVTVRITGDSTLALQSVDGPAEEQAEAFTAPWSTYATFRSEPDGGWRLAWAVDDEDWVVSPELPG